MTGGLPARVGRREFVRWLVAMGVSAAALPALQETAAATPEVVAIVGATVVDGIEDAPRPDLTVVMVGDTIVWMGRSGDAAVPEGARIVDARGKFVIPGLWDMHTHMTATAEAVYPPLYIANGVTGIRDMWGDAALHALRDRIEGGRLLGPRIVIASDIIDGPHSVWPDATQVATPAEARTAVRAAKAAGADEDLMRTLTDTPIDPAYPRRFYDLARELDRQASLDHDPGRARELYDLLARNGTWQVPTLSILRVASSPADTYKNDARLKYIPADVQTYWEQRIGELAPSTPEQISQQTAFLRYRLGLVGELGRAGVGILGGTDTPNPYTFPGFSAHDELELLVMAGLSPMRALQCMTSDAAGFLGLGDVGALAPGKAADLVVLNADPLRDIRNTQKIHAVVSRGRLLTRQRLDSMLADVETAVGTSAEVAETSNRSITGP